MQILWKRDTWCMGIGGIMTRREFLKKSVLLFLFLPFISHILKWIRPRKSPRPAMYYRELAG